MMVCKQNLDSHHDNYAIRRCGELLKQFDARGGDRSKTEGAHSFAVSQRQAAEVAGMSPHQ